MTYTKEALLRELRERTPKSGAYWEKAKDQVPGRSFITLLERAGTKNFPTPQVVAQSITGKS